jgi:hypothetical protein
VFRIFIALLRFSFDSPSYIHHKYHSQCYLSNVRSYQKTDLYGHEKRAWKLYLLSDLLYVLTHRRCKGLSLRLITLSDTLGRTPMEIVSVRRRDLQRITYNIHNIQTTMPLAELKPAIPASDQSQTYAVDRPATTTR